MKKEHLYLSIAVAAIIMYFHARKSTGASGGKIAGLNVKVNPNRLMDGTMAYLGVNPMLHEPIKKVANKVLNKIIT